MIWSDRGPDWNIYNELLSIRCATKCLITALGLFASQEDGQLRFVLRSFTLVETWMRRLKPWSYISNHYTVLYTRFWLVNYNILGHWMNMNNITVLYFQSQNQKQPFLVEAIQYVIIHKKNIYMFFVKFFYLICKHPCRAFSKLFYPKRHNYS